MAPKRGQATKKDHEFLSTASKIIRHRSTKDPRWTTNPQLLMFSLARLKARGTELAEIGVERLLSPEEKGISNDLAQRIVEAAKTVPEKTCKAKEINKPLLDDCALDTDPSPNSAWDLSKRDLMRLHPCDLRELMVKLEPYRGTGDDALISLFADQGVLAWLMDAAANIFEAVREDDRLEYEMGDSLSKVDPDSEDTHDFMVGTYENFAELRKKNLVTLNELTARVATYVFLSVALASMENQWPGFDVVKKFFAERGLRFNKLERFCQVMDVEIRTNRYVVKERFEDEENRTTWASVVMELYPAEKVRDLVEMPKDFKFLQWMSDVMRVFAAKQDSEFENLKCTVNAFYRDHVVTRAFY